MNEIYLNKFLRAIQGVTTELQHLNLSKVAPILKVKDDELNAARFDRDSFIEKFAAASKELSEIKSEFKALKEELKNKSLDYDILMADAEHRLKVINAKNAEIEELKAKLKESNGAK
jgi:primosomal protein N''